MKWSKDLIRTVLSALGSLFVVFGIMNADDVAPLVDAILVAFGAVVALYAMIKSLFSPADNDPPPVPQ